MLSVMIPQSEKAINYANWVKGEKASEWLKGFLLPKYYKKEYQDTLAGLIMKDASIASFVRFEHKVHPFTINYALIFAPENETLKIFFKYKDWNSYGNLGLKYTPPEPSKGLDV